jgi:hypothetical protein
MSAISLKGNASGTGTLTIAAPNTNTNQTLTLPDLTGTLAVNGPAFSAYNSSATTLATSTITKVAFQSEEFDTASAFDSTTNYRFLPLVAGYYQVNGCVNATSMQGGLVTIYKNGLEFKRGAQYSSINVAANVSALVYLNGSSDYIELWAYQASGLSQTTSTGTTATYFSASMVRGA